MNPLQTLFDTTQGRVRYAVKAYALVIVPVMLLSILLTTLFPDMQGPPLDTVLALGPVALIFLVAILGPFLETLLMWPIISLLSRLTGKTWVIASVSATLWGIFHSLQAPLWGFVIFWAFVVLSIAFTEWRKKSVWDAICVTFLIHGLQNLTAVMLTLLAPESA